MKSQEKLVTWFMEAPLLAFFFSALAIYYTQTFFCNLLLLLYNLDSLVSLGRKVEKVGLFWHKLLPFVHSVPSKIICSKTEKYIYNEYINTSVK